MWSPTTFSLFIVYCRALTICEKNTPPPKNEVSFDTAFEQLRQRVGLVEVDEKLLEIVRFVSTLVEVEEGSESTWFQNGRIKREGMRILEKAWIMHLSTQCTTQELNF
jgi:predicted CoA-binding protein